MNEDWIKKQVLQRLPQCVINSKIYYHVYYKHTAKHKEDLEDTYHTVLKSRGRIIGK